MCLSVRLIVAGVCIALMELVSFPLNLSLNSSDVRASRERFLLAVSRYQQQPGTTGQRMCSKVKRLDRKKVICWGTGMQLVQSFPKQERVMFARMFNNAF